MKTFAGIPIEDFAKENKVSRKKWCDLEHDDPQEYQRRVNEMSSTIDRYNSEIGIDDDSVDDDE